MVFFFEMDFFTRLLLQTREASFRDGLLLQNYKPTVLLLEVSRYTAVSKKVVLVILERSQTKGTCWL